MFSDPNANLSKLGLSLGMKVVDLGAGSGFYTIESARRVGPGGRVYAIDVQKDLLERIRTAGAQQNLRNIEVVWANAEKIGGTKLRENIADRVIASNVLFQIEKPEEFALEIKRLIKPGGKVMVIDWNGGSPLSPKTLFPSARAQMLFEKIGFKLDQSFGAGDHHYGLVLTRS
ncbi:MAG: methyltransferase domain-containing protein [Candidatus Pacebacteria bacterium]|nr:methyltransferase domain-containing protein [Candidatus Paceibacterota bacterium]